MWNPGERKELGLSKRKDIMMCIEDHLQQLIGKARKQPMPPE